MKNNSPYTILLIIIIYCANIVIVNAQTSTELIPYRQGKLWGYADVEGKIIVAPTYDKVSFFGYNYESYSMEEFYSIPESDFQTASFINTESNDDEFSNPIAFVKKGNAIGIMNIKGELILPPIQARYLQLIYKRNGIYEVHGKSNNEGEGDEMENVKCAYLFDNNLKCTPLVFTTCIECGYNLHSESTNYSGFDDLNLKYIIVRKDKKQFLLKNDGKIEGSISFDKISMFENDWLIGTNHYENSKGDSKSQSLLWNVKNGMKLDLGNSISVLSGGNGFFNIRRNDSLFVLNTSGSMKYLKDVNFISNYTKDGIALLGGNDGILRLITNKGDWVYNNKSVNPYTSIMYKNEKYWLSKEGFQYFQFDPKTKNFIAHYDEIPKKIELFDKEYFEVVEGNKYGLMDLSEKIVLDYNYDKPFEVFDTVKKYIKVSKGGKQGLLNNNFKEILPIEFDIVEAYGYGFLSVDKNGLKGLIKMEDLQVIIPVSMHSISSTESEEGALLFSCYNGKENLFYNVDGSRYFFKEDTIVPIQDYFNNVFYEPIKEGNKNYIKEQNGKVNKLLYAEDRRSYITMFSNNLGNRYFVIFHNLDSLKNPWIDRSDNVEVDTSVSNVTNFNCNQYYAYNVNVVAEIFDSNYIKIATGNDYFVSLYGNYILANRKDGYKLIDFKNGMNELPYNFKRFEVDYINKEMYLFENETSNISKIIDYREGKEIKKPESFYKYTYVYPAVGIRFVANNCRYGLIDKEDKELIPPIYKNMKTAGNGNFIVRDDNMNVGIINAQNQYITPPIYQDIYLFGNNFVAFIKEEKNSIVLIKSNGAIFKTISNVKEIWHSLVDPFDSNESIPRRSNFDKCIFIQNIKEEWTAIRNDFTECDYFFTYSGGYEHYRYFTSPNFKFDKNVFASCLENKLHIEKLSGGGTIILDRLKHRILGVINKDGEWTVPLLKSDLDYFIIKNGFWIDCFKYSNSTHSYIGSDGNFIIDMPDKEVIYLQNVQLFCIKKDNNLIGFVGPTGFKYFVD